MITATRELPEAQDAPTTNRDYISYSSLNTFRHCGLQYYFRYIVGLREDCVSSSLVFGCGIHRSIECHFRAMLAGDTLPDLDMLLAEFWDEWRERDQEHIRFGKGEDLNVIGQLAERTLVAFQQSESANPQGKILAVEEELRGPIVPGCPDVLGRIDLIVDTGTELVIHDWKTSRNRWSHEQAQDASEQLLLYAELARDFAPGKPMMLEFMILTKTKEVVIDRHLLPVDPTAISRVKRVVEQVWRSIDAGHFYPSPSAMNCPGCPYRQQCRTWGG